MELLFSALGMLGCMAAMIAIMPLFARVMRLARRHRAADAGHRDAAVGR
jgi:hypothetical protein